MELLIGILSGLALSLFFSFGPAFFSLLQNSIRHGFKKAFLFVCGVSLSDVIIVFLMLTVLRNIDMDATLHNVWVSVIGAAVMAYIGWCTFRQKAKSIKDERGMSRMAYNSDSHWYELLLHGLALNILNPLNWIYWISIITFVSGEVGLSVSERYVFFTGLLAGNLLMDMLKCRLASLLKKFINHNMFNIFNRIVGGIMMAFAVYLIGSMIHYQATKNQHETKTELPTQSEGIIKSLHDNIPRQGTPRK